MWTKNTIDISIFHEKKENSNIYSNSYIKEYLEKVVRAKMQAASIRLPWIKNKNTDIMDTGTAQSYSDTEDKKTALKWQKITDYTKDVHASYKTLRNINNIEIHGDESYLQHTRLSTRYTVYNDFTWSIDPSGVIDWYRTYDIYGLRPVITK